ncbi:hypothetical protein [Micromonospora maritima]|uniref:hypothetical protein n=1 Tax=Micromonospora maritima TaxID=986711 RepID=UPI00157D300B|nr:hypothetical protein [Micromonospora maritima]
MTDLFDAPATSTGGAITDFDGALLLVTPTEIRENVPTKNGPSDATVADVQVVDGPQAGTELKSILVFQKILQKQLRPKVGTGRMVLGRLGKGTATPGKTAPWILGDPTDQDKQAARDHLAKVAPPF